MDRTAVDKLSFDVPAGSIVGLLGPNGAGKTTLTKLMCGVTSPTTGRVEVLGSPPAAHGGQQKRLIGVVHQSSTFDMMLPVLDNLRITAAFKGLPWREARSRVDDLLELFGLAETRAQLAFTLSGGQQRRLQVVRALLTVPRLLLLDEPSAGLDVAGRRQVWSLIAEMRRHHGMTVIWTSHYVEELERNCDQVLIMDRGRMIEFAAPRELTQRFGTHSLEDAFLELLEVRQ
jgi:ABC-2 type transport system ATP-binding protein